MKQMICEICGCNNLIKQDGMFVCQDCGTKYSVEDARKLLIDTDSTVRSSNTFSNYLEMAESAYNSGNHSEAELYCNKILESDPKHYKALLIKGKAAGWQSTLQNSRLPETISSFVKALQNAPDDEKSAVSNDAKNEFVNLSKALISLRAERFEKWPDVEESTGLFNDITNIMNAGKLLDPYLESHMNPLDLMKSVAPIIDNSVGKAVVNKINPDYKSEQYPYPSDNDFREYIDRIALCTTLMSGLIDLCKGDDEGNLTRYQFLINLHKAAISGCSYEYKTVTYEGSFWSDYQPVYKNEYVKSLSLTSSAVAERNALIRKYEQSIKEIKDKKARIAAEERAEKERKELEAAQKRYNDYWETHAAEKAELESEKEKLQNEISELQAASEAQIIEMNNKLRAIPGKEEIDALSQKVKELTAKRDSLGLFKGKEKKELQSLIDKANEDKTAVTDRMSAEAKPYLDKIGSIKSEISSKISALKKKIKHIDNELTKAR